MLLLFFNACDMLTTADVEFSADFKSRYEIIDYRAGGGDLQNTFRKDINSYYVSLWLNKKGSTRSNDGIRAVFYNEEGMKLGEDDRSDYFVGNGKQVCLSLEVATLAPKFQNSKIYKK
jgi:hypothetical protein